MDFGAGFRRFTLAALAVSSVIAGSNVISHAQAATGKPPNIVVIMSDDVGWFNIGAYNRGIMSGRTPNLDKLASEGMLFTDYYAEASCTAGRANFITGEIPLRTGINGGACSRAFTRAVGVGGGCASIRNGHNCGQNAFCSQRLHRGAFQRTF
jgi:Sulfatase